MTKSRTLGNLVKDGAVQFPDSLGTAGQALQVNSGATGLEFADASGGVTVYTGLSGTDGTPSGATYLLNASSPSAGDLAYVTANTSLYQNNGNGWYRIVTVNTSPTLSSPATGTDIALSATGTPSTVTITAADSDVGTTLQYSYTVSTGSLTNGGGTTATVYGADGTSERIAGTNYTDNVFKIDPTTNTAHGGSFSLTFNATDTINTAQTIQNFTLGFDITWGADRGTFAGGFNYSTMTGNSDIIRYFDITTQSNIVSDFGNLRVGRSQLAGVSNKSKIVWSGSNIDNISSTNRRKMDYINPATTGDASDFVGLYKDNRACLASASDGTKGLFFGAGQASTNTNEIEQITIDSQSNSSDFGDRTESMRSISATGNATYALSAGGFTGASTRSDRIDRTVYDTLNSSSDFGNLNTARSDLTAVADNDRAVFSSGNSSTGVACNSDYVSIASSGSASSPATVTNFGTNSEMTFGAGQSNGTRGVWKAGSNDNTVHYIVIQTTSAALDFGDLTYKGYNLAGASGNAA